MQLAAAGTGGSKSFVDTLKATVMAVINAIVSNVLALFRGITSLFGGAGKAGGKVRACLLSLPLHFAPLLLTSPVCATCRSMSTTCCVRRP